MQGDEYKSMKELGQEFGLTSHKIGRTLKDIGLRTEEGKPSHTAFEQGYVKRRWAEQRSDIYLWVWHYDKTVAALESAGVKRVNTKPQVDHFGENAAEPYSFRRNGTTGSKSSIPVER